MNVTISQLWVGDRFAAHNSLWTWLGDGRARRHSKESIRLGKIGYGYIGDNICSFEPEDSVFFIAPDGE